MKKIFILLLLIPFIVNAKEQINLAWSKNPTGYIYYGMQDEDNYIFLEYEGGQKVTTYSSSGEKINSVSYQSYVGNDISKQSILSGIDNNYYEPNTLAIINLTNKTIQDCSGDNCIDVDYQSLTTDELKRLAGNYYFIFNLAISNPNKQYSDYKYNNEYHSVVYSTSTGDGIEIYNKSGRIVFQKEFTDVYKMTVSTSPSGIYALKEFRRRSGEDYTITKYNYNGNEEYTVDISDDVASDDEFTIEDVNTTNDGFIVTLVCKVSSCSTRGYILNYKTSHEIITKINGQGKIEVNKSANNDETVVVKITPEKGYVLTAVKITDAEGNTINYTNSSFAMPNRDVTIEATFTLEKTNGIKNPNTIDTILIALPFLILGGIATCFMYKKVSWLK